MANKTKNHPTDLYEEVGTLFTNAQLEIVACELCGDYHPPDIHLAPITPDEPSEPSAASAGPNITLDDILADRPFATLGYSADGAVWCPSCLRAAAGLSPGRPDSDGRAIIPLYTRDTTVHDERCENCDRHLVSLLLANHRTPDTVTAQLTARARYWSLSFDRIPPLRIREALSKIGWRWDPASRTWFSRQPEPAIPPSVVLAPPAPPKPRAALPIVRRRTPISPDIH